MYRPFIYFYDFIPSQNKIDSKVYAIMFFIFFKMTVLISTLGIMGDKLYAH